MNLVRKTVSVLFAILLFAPSVRAAGEAKPAALPAPAGTPGFTVWTDFSLQTPGGESVSLSQFIGKKPILLDFWATWCPPCKERIPTINRIHAEAAGKLQVLALDYMESAQKVGAFAKAKEIRYPVLLDSRGNVARSYKVVGVPTYIIIDRQGKIVYRDNAFPADLKKYYE